MSILVPAPFADLVTRLYVEPGKQGSLFDLGRRNWYDPPAQGPDLSVRFHGQRAGNPVGPASGPHTQMAQNLLLAYIAGARIMELKTVQINDRLEIPRPCIDMANVGYNVEWSQELLVEDSLAEYVAGMMLIEMFRAQHPEAASALKGRAGDVIYDLSVGYDLAGIKSAKVQGFLNGARDTSKVIDRHLHRVPSTYRGARDLNFPKTLSTTLTLSTFHGCPTDEIEKICEFLMGERELDVVVKMNPPTIGREELEHILHDELGYTDITVRQSAYSGSQTFAEAVEMTRRLCGFAKSRGRRFGCKFSNTLEVMNHRKVFGSENEVMYLSSAPLHVITMALTAKFREVLGPNLPISFSAGIDASNFANAVSCGFVPVTTCSDLLKTGGYGRLPDYLKNLGKAMEVAGAHNIDDFILKGHGQGAEARRLATPDCMERDIVNRAAVLNTAVVAKAVRQDPRYRAENNRREPKRTDSRLVTFDCLTCDKCVPVCPNDANFTYALAAVEFDYDMLRVKADGTSEPAERRRFAITKKHQIANFAEFCNECGNCDTFCPEYGGPYIEKPSFFRTHESYVKAAPRDGFVVEGGPERGSITGRIKGHEYRLDVDIEAERYRFSDGNISATILGKDFQATRARAEHEGILDMGIFHSMRHLRAGVLDPSRINQVNAAAM